MYGISLKKNYFIACRLTVTFYMRFYSNIFLNVLKCFGIFMYEMKISKHTKHMLRKKSRITFIKGNTRLLHLKQLNDELKTHIPNAIFFFVSH